MNNDIFQEWNNFTIAMITEMMWVSFVTDEDETHDAFCKHMEEQLALYKQLSVVSLSELSGKEQVIGEAFLTHILNYNSPKITFIAFDFHDYWWVGQTNSLVDYCVRCNSTDVSAWNEELLGTGLPQFWGLCPM